MGSGVVVESAATTLGPNATGDWLGEMIGDDGSGEESTVPHDIV
jgi:hypothetical protein